MLVSFNLLTALFSLFYVLVSAYIGFLPGIYIMLLNFSIYWVNLFFIKQGLSFRAAANIYLFNSLFIAIYGCTWFSGGLYSPVIPWFVLVPVTSLLLLGAGKNTFIWLAFASACVLSFLLVIQVFNIHLAKNYMDEWTNFFFYCCFGGLVLILFIITMVFENIKNKALVETSAKNKELQQAVLKLKTAHEQLVQQEKLASLGQITAGIAHEIKNPLNFVTNFSELSMELLQELQEETDEAIKEQIFTDLISNLNKIKHHGNKADFTVKSMLQHSRMASSEMEVTDLNKICHEYMNLAFHGIRVSYRDFNSTISKQLDPNLPVIHCIPQDLSRVILNLLNNAMYAVKDKHSDAAVSIRTYFDAKQVYIEVKDNGMGMNEETQRKLFEPFYTTKPTGQGTGLGLSISFDIVKTHGGTIEVSSALDEGSVFTVALPIR